MVYDAFSEDLRSLGVGGVPLEVSEHDSLGELELVGVKVLLLDLVVGHGHLQHGVGYVGVGDTRPSLK